jgi:hypothetical protein
MAIDLPPVNSRASCPRNCVRGKEAPRHVQPGDIPVSTFITAGTLLLRWQICDLKVQNHDKIARNGRKIVAIEQHCDTYGQE